MQIMEGQDSWPTLCQKQGIHESMQMPANSGFYLLQQHPPRMEIEKPQLKTNVVSCGALLQETGNMAFKAGGKCWQMTALQRRDGEEGCGGQAR